MIKTIENIKGVSGIYAIIHRETGRCYIGSAVDLERRRKRHLQHIKNGGLQRIHAAVIRHGIDQFDFEVLERCHKQCLLEREGFYIALFDSTSSSDFNVQAVPVARYGWTITEATRERLRLAHLGKKLSLETRLKMRASAKGKIRSPEHCANLSLVKTGTIHSEATRQKISATQKGRTQSKSTIQKRQRSMRGRIHARNSSGFVGTSRSLRDGKWKAAISVNGKQKFLGRFPTPEAASSAYQAALLFSPA